jgi:hypothetical protein
MRETDSIIRQPQPTRIGDEGLPRGYRIGFDRHSGLSQVTAGDCAHEMIRMLGDDAWLHMAPVIQY